MSLPPGQSGGGRAQQARLWGSRVTWCVPFPVPHGGQGLPSITREAWWRPWRPNCRRQMAVADPQGCGAWQRAHEVLRTVLPGLEDVLGPRGHLQGRGCYWPLRKGGGSSWSSGDLGQVPSCSDLEVACLLGPRDGAGS